MQVVAKHCVGPVKSVIPVEALDLMVVDAVKSVIDTVRAFV